MFCCFSKANAVRSSSALIPIANDAAVRQDEWWFVADRFIQKIAEIAQKLQSRAEVGEAGRLHPFESSRNHGQTR